LDGQTVHVGTFDAEVYWRPADLAALPALTDRRGLEQVAVMDELLAGFCAPGDLLVTRRPVPVSLRTALAESGFCPRYRSPAEPGPADPSTAAEPVERAVLRDVELTTLIASYPFLAPYAVLPDTVALADKTGHGTQLPDAAVVARVNSKSFSDGLVHRLGLPGGGRVVRSLADLPAAVEAAGDVVLLKDPCGVGGRGILEISSPGMLRPILRALQRQVAHGKRVELVVQPKWRKQWDISGYLDVSADGRVELTGMQLVEHRGVSHVGVGPLPGHLADLLHRLGYPEALRAVGAAVAAEGYRGPIGVDSLLLDDGSLVPVLELNARRSMGMLNMAIDRRLRRGAARSHLWRLSLTVPDGAGIGALIDALRAGEALYAQRPGVGVLPLTGTGLCPPRGRFECALICPPDEVEPWRQRVRSAAASVGMTELGSVHTRAG
jgi:hypothetical protein